MKKSYVVVTVPLGSGPEVPVAVEEIPATQLGGSTMQAVVEAPLSQREKALALANRIRCHRAKVKVGLKDQTIGVFDAVEDPMCATMPVFDVLLSLPYFGRARVNRLLRSADINPARPCGALTPHQRERLAEWLGVYDETVLLRV